MLPGLHQSIQITTFDRIVNYVYSVDFSFAATAAQGVPVLQGQTLGPTQQDTGGQLEEPSAAQVRPHVASLGCQQQPKVLALCLDCVASTVGT